MSRPSLPVALAEAFLTDARRNLGTIRAAIKAPALFKPDAVEQARRNYAHETRGQAA